MKRFLSLLLAAVLLLELAVPAGQTFASSEERIQPINRDGSVRTVTGKLGELASAVSGNVYGEAARESAAPAAARSVTKAVYLQPTPEPPVLFPLPELTNSASLEVAGTAALNAMVTVYLAPAGGWYEAVGQTVASEVYGPDTGKFTVTVRIPQDDGDYRITATADKDGELSEEAAPVRFAVDRTPPAEPYNIDWKGIGNDAIELQWDPPMIPDPNIPGSYREDPTVDHYVVEKNKQQVAETKERYYFEGNLGEMEKHTYSVRAVDKLGNMSTASTVTVATFHKNAVLVAKTPDGAEYGDAYWQPTISENGKAVAYVAYVPDEASPHASPYGVYVYDIPSGKTERIADMPDVQYRLDDDQFIDISPDGRYVAYSENFEDGRHNVVVYDRVTKVKDRLPKDFGSFAFSVSMSDDAQWIAFTSAADDIVDGDDNEYSDVFLYNRMSRQVKRISVSAEGVQGDDASLQSVMTGNGRYAMFVSYAGNLVPGLSGDLVRMFIYDTSIDKLEHVPAKTDDDDSERMVWWPYPSVDGRYVVFTSSYGTEDKRLYLMDRQTGRSEGVISFPRNADIGFRDPRLSGSGRYVSMEYYNYDPGSGNNGPSGVFDSQWGAVRYDLVNKEFKRVGNRAASTYDTSISGDGAKVAFTVSRSAVYVACLETAERCDFAPQQEDKILRPGWSMNPQVHGGMPAMGGSFTVRAYSRSGEQLEAVGEYKAAAGSGTESKPLRVEMTESASTPGLFLGEADIPADAVEISSISVRLKNDPSVFKQVGSFPVKVAGRLKVSVQSEYPDALAGASVLLWSEEKKLGASGKLSPSLEASVNVGEAADYKLTVVDSAGRSLLEQGSISVSSGKETGVTVSVRPRAELKAVLLDDSSAAIYQQVDFYDSQNRPLFSGRTDNSGKVALWGTHFAGETVKIRAGALLPYVPVENTVVLQPGTNEKTVHLERMAAGVVKGKVTDAAGAPVKGAKVELFSQGKGVWLDTVADESGMYEIQADPGIYLVSARMVERPFSKSQYTRAIEVNSGYVAENNLILHPSKTGFIKIDAELKRVDADWQPLDVSDWRTAVHYGLRAKSPSGHFYGNSSTINGNRMEVIGKAGDTVEVCMSGREAGLTDHCDEVVLDEQLSGTAKIRLEEKARISGKLVGDANFSGYQIAVYGKGNAGSYFSRYANLDANGSFSTSVPRSGTYSVTINGPGVWSSRDVTVADGELKSLEPITVSRANSLFQGKPGNGINSGELTAMAGDTVTVRGSYKLASGAAAVSDASLVIPIPAGTSLPEGSVMMNGVSATPVIQDGKAIVPIGQIASGKDGAFSFRLKMGSAVSSDVQMNVTIRYTPAGADSQKEELLGAAFVRVGEVSLEAPELSLNRTIRVSGRAPAGQKVTVYADEAIVGYAVATAGGLWYTQVTLPEKAPDTVWNEAARYRLTAKAETTAGFAQSQPVIASVDPNHVVITKFTMRQSDGRSVSFDPAQGVARFPYVVVPGMPMHFEAQFNAPERVSGVRITVGETDIPVRWNSTSKKYEATEVASMYMGTGVYVSYDIKPKEYEPRPAPAPKDWEAAQNALSDFWRKAKYEIVEEGEAPPQWRTLTEAAGDGFYLSKPVKATFEVEGQPLVLYVRWRMKPVDKPSGYAMKIDEAAGTMTMSAAVPASLLDPQQLKELSGLVGTAAAPENYILNELEFLFPDDGQGTGVQKLAASARGLGVPAIPEPVKNAGKVLGTLNKLRTYVTDSLDLAKYADDLIAFQDYVINSECHVPTVNHYIQATDQLYEQAARDLVAKSVLTGVGLVAGTLTLALPPIGAFALTAAANKIGNLAKDSWQENLKLLKEEFEKDKKWRDDMAAAGAIDRCKKKDDDDDENKKKRRKDDDKVADPTWIWDPSGYVYEAVPGNRVEGVTATLLQQDTATGEWRVWDAEWFGQQNPLTTDRQGRYGWDVPEGKWKVLYEKEGYLPAESAELTVLPPHFDVNVPMVSRQAPKVAVIDAVYGDGVRVAFTKYMLDGAVTDSSIAVETAEGDKLAGTVEPVAPATDDQGQTVANRFRFVPDPGEDKFKQGESYTVKVGAQVLSYARVAMEEDHVAAGVVVKAANAAPADAAAELQAAGGKRMIALEWKRVEGADPKGYKLYWQPKSGGPAQFKEVAADQTFAVLEGLAHSTVYDVKLVTVGHNGVESAGVDASAETLQEEALDMDTTAPGKVTGAAAAAERQALMVTWTDPADSDLRKVLVSWKAEGEARYHVPEYVDKGVQSLRLENLAPNTGYTIRLTAADTHWNESDAVEISGRTSDTPDTTAPGNVISPTARGAKRSIAVSWTDPADADLKHILVSWRRSGTDEPFGSAVAVAKGVQRYDIAGLAEKAEYEIKLVAEDDGGNQASGVTVSARTLDTTAPGNVISPAARGAKRSIAVSWTDPADADLKQILVSWRRSGTDEPFGSATAVAKGVQRYDITGLAEKTEYEVRLAAEDEGGNQASGVTVSAGTLEDNRRPSGGGGGSSVPAQPADPGGNGSGSGSETVDVSAEAKTWSGFDGRIALDIAAGTFESGRKLVASEIGEDGAAVPDGYRRYSSVFRLNPDSGSMALVRPMKLTLKYDADKHRDFDARKLGIYRQDEADPAKWHYAGGVFDSKTGTIAAAIHELGNYAVLDYSRIFADLNGHWSKRDMEVLISRHIVDGMTDTEFQPDLSITRAQFTKLLVQMTADTGRIFAAPGGSTETAPFRDVPAGSWHFPYIAEAKKKGLVQGGEDGSFRPDDPLTREELAVLVVRLLGLEPQAKQLEAAGGGAASFTDGGDIAKWALAYVELARSEQLVDGVGGGAFAPREAASRAQGAVLILRAMSKLGLIGQ
ncbi:S-layer homology domain-containing protein [Paenibacillus hamazuiensis]|uniref:S-layer homology domain-containing protein n=1 Tax=Paenibacillus hamazuiensis TaxID=2936508 RepID=UPI00200FBE2E|nr:fibronectin type III domain-containing protein [Paenibacillus hamazuiensis]